MLEFNDAVAIAAIPSALQSKMTFQDPYREFLRNDYPVYFSHADLNLSNIMVSGLKGAHYISGIIDWEQAGWYPEYWEHCKMALGIDSEHEWRTKGYLERVTGAFDDELLAFAEYTSWQGF